MSEPPQRARVELAVDDEPRSLIGFAAMPGEGRRGGRLVVLSAGALLVCALVIGFAVVAAPEAQRRPASDPDALRDLVARIGGLPATSLGSATGAFDLVTFDPIGNNRLLAVHRDGYGPAENQSSNEIWELTGAGVEQRLWQPQLPHDYAHFNADGTLTAWVNGDEKIGFAPRVASVVDRRGTEIAVGPAVYAARSVTVAGRVFALTGSSDWFGAAEPYDSIVALDSEGSTTLAPAADAAWISAEADVVIVYPADDSGRTAVWNAETLESMSEHPLADRSFARAAVSGDESTAVGIGFDGRLHQIDMASGGLVSTFGSIEPAPIDRPIELDEKGRIAVTVDEFGDVAVWYVGGDLPLATVDGDISLTRWLQDRRASRPASVIAPDATRVALRLAATPGVEVRWEIIETTEEAWRRHRREPLESGELRGAR